MRMWLIVVLGALLAGITYAAYEIELADRIVRTADTVATGIKSTSAQAPESIIDAQGESAAGNQGAESTGLNSEAPEPTARVAALPPRDEMSDAGSSDEPGGAAGNAPVADAPIQPTFDVVSVDPDGTAVVAGRAEPGALVTLKFGAEEIGTAQASERGEWVIVPDQPLSGGTAVLALQATPRGGSTSVRSSQTVTVVLPEIESAASDTAIGSPPPSSETEIAETDAAPAVAESQAAGGVSSMPAASSETSIVVGSLDSVASDAVATTAQRVLVPPTPDASMPVASAGQEPSGEIGPVGVSTSPDLPRKAVGGRDEAISDVRTPTAVAADETVAPAEEPRESAAMVLEPPPPAALTETPPASEVVASLPRAGNPEPEPVVVADRPAEASPGTADSASEGSDAPMGDERVLAVAPILEQPTTTVETLPDSGVVTSATAVAQPSAADEVAIEVVENSEPSAQEGVADGSPGPAPTPRAIESEMTAMATAPQSSQAAPSAAAQGPMVVLSEPGAPSRVLQRTDEADEPRGPVTFESVDYDDAGQIIVAGRTGPQTDVRAYIDNQLLGDARADAKGQWMLRATRDIKPGAYELRVDQIGTEGMVIARVAVPFERAEPEVIARARSRGQVVIQPGDNLWNIARSIYGAGTQYTVIYSANTNQIDNPDLIYPGQVLVTPGGAPPAGADNASVGTAG